MQELDYNRVNAFIQKVFNYYNGRINIVNYPAMLNINWAGLQYGNEEAGNTRLPNIVEICPMVIKNHVFKNYKGMESFAFYYIIIETIIHELFHIDQIIDYWQLGIYNYKMSIECAVETQTNIYIASHAREILENFGIDISYVDNKKTICRYDNGYAYHRKYYEDQIIALISIMERSIDISNLIKAIKTNIKNLSGKITITLNGQSIVVQDNSYLIPIAIINQIFYDNLYKYKLFNKILCTYDIDGNNIIINININAGNIMVKCI